MFPTFAAVAGAKLPDGVTIDGRSYAPQLRGEKGMPREWVFVQLGREWYVREQDWKLTEGGALLDMTDAPFAEKPVPAQGQSEAAAAARQHLQAVLAKLNPAAAPSSGKPKKMRAKERRAAAADAQKPSAPTPDNTPPK